MTRIDPAKSARAAQHLGEDAMTQTVEITAVDIHRWYCAPWCPKCGQMGWGIDHDRNFCGKCGLQAGVKPGLHDRHPATKPEELEWVERDSILSYWYLDADDETCCEPTPTQAADLCLAGVVKAIPTTELSTFFREVCTFMLAYDCTIHEAAAKAFHLYLDSL